MAKSRIFNIMQYVCHPESGEPLLNEEKIKDALAHRTIKRWAYILHDGDVYSALDEEHNPEHIKGELKPPHWHIVIEMGSNQVEVGVIARWLGIADNFVDVAKGHGAFLDCCEYLTHEDEKQQGLGKRLYPDEKVSANFDFRKELTERAERKAKYGRDLDEKERMCYDVLYNGKSLRECREADPITYMAIVERLTKLRMRYIETLPPPTTRINFYIAGDGGLGKGLMSRGIARSLFPQYTNDEEIFFEVGAKGAAFEGYDGQPVIIWNDRRAIDLLIELNGRGNVFNVFDTHPTRQRQNIKYGSVNLCNSVNIVNSVEGHMEFLNALAGEYKDRDGVLQKVEDKGQSYRRFPFIIPLHEEDYDLLLNKGFVENTSNFTEYLEYFHIRGNMAKIAALCGGNEQLARALEKQAVSFVIDKYQEIISSASALPDITEEEIQKLMLTLGKPREDVEAGEVIGFFEAEDLFPPESVVNPFSGSQIEVREDSPTTSDSDDSDDFGDLF